MVRVGVCNIRGECIPGITTGRLQVHRGQHHSSRKAENLARALLKRVHFFYTCTHKRHDVRKGVVGLDTLSVDVKSRHMLRNYVGACATTVHKKAEVVDTLHVFVSIFVV